MNSRISLFMSSILFLILLCGCSTEDLVVSDEKTFTDTIRVVDTIYKSDTIVIDKSDTIIVNKIDTVIINKIDTVVTVKYDTVITTKKDTTFHVDTIINRDTVINSQTFSYEAEIFAVIYGLGSCQGHSFQGFAAYQDFAFGFYDSGICRCIDLNSKEIISEFNLPGAAFNKSNHAGVACFSEEFLTSNDEFPLLYLSSYKEYKCYVLRLFRDHAEIVQTLLTKTEPDVSGKTTIAPIVGYEPDRDKLLLKIKESKNLYQWITVYRPSITYGETYYIDLKDKLDVYYAESSASYNAGFVENGKIYQLAGYTPGERKLYILDYVNKKTLVDILWNNSILTGAEQEQCTRFKDGILINYNGAHKLVYVKFNNWEF